MLPQQQSLGEILGAGLSDVASHWANVKSSEKALRGLGLNEAQSKSLARLQSPQLQQQLIQHQLQQQQQQASNAAINQILGEGLPPVNFQQQSPMQSLGQPQMRQVAPMQQVSQQSQTPIEQASSVLQNPAFQKLQKQAQDAQQLQQAQLSPKGKMAAPQAAGALPGEGQAIVANQIAQQKEPSFKDRLEDVSRRRRALAALPLSNKEKIDANQFLQGQENAIRQEMRDAEKAKSEKEKIADKKQARIDAETLPYYEKIKKDAESADEMIMRIDQYEELLNTGKVSSNTFLTFLDEIGQLPGVTGAFGRMVSAGATNTETQVAKKLAADFMIGAKDALGSQMPVAEMQMWMQRVPSLMQTIEGQRAILRNFRGVADKQKANDRAMEGIIASNNDERPRHLQSKVSKAMEGYKGDMRKSFRDSIHLINKEQKAAGLEREQISREARANVNKYVSTALGLHHIPGPRKKR